MDLVAAFITVLGLAVFETVSSFDNAVINAGILGTLSDRARRWFLSWGILVSVFIVRAALPLLLVLALNPQLGLAGVLGSFDGSNAQVAETIHASAPPLLGAGGMFLLVLFLHWLLVEPKEYAASAERRFSVPRLFYPGCLLLVVVYAALSGGPLSSAALGGAVGTILSLLALTFRQRAEERERKLLEGPTGADWNKLVFLEMIDASFSVDGVLGAFAFTLSVPLIILGTSVGAVVVRQLTVHGIQTVKKLRYLKNGAMYSLACLSAVMLAESSRVEVPGWVSPLTTFAVLGCFGALSWRAARASHSR